MRNLRIMHLLVVATMMAVPSVSKAFMVDGIEYIFFDDLQLLSSTALIMTR